jgi:apolipoprotein N-acyltransferase
MDTSINNSSNNTSNNTSNNASPPTHGLLVTRLKPWQANGLATLSGAVIPFALAPFDFWPLAVLGPALLVWLLQGLNGKQALWRSWWSGAGLFGVGASWVWVSIHDFGYAPFWLATLLTALFVAGLALLFSLPFYAYGRWFNHHRWSIPLAFPVIWVLGEWLRSWLLTGFPWLYIGYSQLDTVLAGWAPVVGVFGLSLILSLSAGAVVYSLLQRRPLWLVAPLLLWITGTALQAQHWTQPTGQPVSVGIVQANIPQEKKWQPDFLLPTLERYSELTEPLWQQDWVIWPEAAIPMTYHRALPFLEDMHRRAAETNTGLITGILYDDRQTARVHNSINGLGTATGLYHKRRLVPFGEYVPLEDILRGTIQFFNLPTSIIYPGPDQQRGLQIGANRLAPALCYEVVYPDLVARSAHNTEVLLTISNDAWFGHSLGPIQHMQMARMRALETGRYMIRGTNNGISAIINPQGKVEVETEQFVKTTLTGDVQPYRGTTPFMHWQSTPVVALCGLLLILIGGLTHREKAAK